MRQPLKPKLDWLSRGKENRQNQRLGLQGTLAHATAPLPNSPAGVGLSSCVSTRRPPADHGTPPPARPLGICSKDGCRSVPVSMMAARARKLRRVRSIVVCAAMRGGPGRVRRLGSCSWLAGWNLQGTSRAVPPRTQPWPQVRLKVRREKLGHDTARKSNHPTP